MTFRKIIVLLFLCFCACLSYAQGEFVDSREASRYNINQFGAKINTDGFGLQYTFAQRVNYKIRRNFEVEYDYIKSLTEVKMINTYFSSSGRGRKKFVIGKDNSVHNIRLGYGYNFMLFEKRDRNSVSIHLQAHIGFSFAFQKPVYYSMVDSISIQNDLVYYYQSDYRFAEYYSGRGMEIVSRAPFAVGLNEIKVSPGNYLKLDLSFDIAQDAMRVSAIEIGTILDYYYLPMTIMYNQPKHFCWSLYVAYQFGQKYNPNLNRDYRKEERKKMRQSNP